MKNILEDMGTVRLKWEFQDKLRQKFGAKNFRKTQRNQLSIYFEDAGRNYHDEKNHRPYYYIGHLKELNFILFIEDELNRVLYDMFI